MMDAEFDKIIPLVSISCITYNHAPYIRQCIDGFLMQKTDFSFEVLIHDDASTDGTEEIIREYEAKNPVIIKPIYEVENQWQKGRIGSKIFNLPRAKGKYIALCEGDDYWIDPLKLQKQVDFLENNPDYIMVYSMAKVYIEKNNRFQNKFFGKAISSFEELLLENSISTPTVLFRKEGYLDYIKEIKPEEKNWLMGDYPLWLYFTSTSKIKCLNYPSSVYRVLENSAAHSTNPTKELLFLESYQAIKLHYIKLKMRGSSHLEKEIWGRYFSNKANIYLLKNEQNIADLVKEINIFKDKTFKINVLNFLLKNRLFRNFLKSYWKFKSSS